MLGDALVEQDRSVTETLIRFAWVCLFSLLPPLLAAVQTLATQRSRNLNSQTTLRIDRQITIHAVLWLTCSLAIASILKWPSIVRFDLGLKNIVLLDELIILAPMTFALIASWWIQSDYQASVSSGKITNRHRRQFVLLRCRVYLAIVMVPILAMLVIRDLWPSVSMIAPEFAIFLALAAIVIMLLFLPVFIVMLWENRSIEEHEGRSELLTLCHSHDLKVKDIRIWDTGQQIANALVTGILPRFRVVMLSDLLVGTFPRRELCAILRHEAGHVRLGHLPVRIGFIIVPALAMVAVQLDTNQTLANIINPLLASGGLPIDLNLLLGFVFTVYTVLVSAWLSRNMEYEADLYAVGVLPNFLHSARTGKVEQNSLADALLRFGEQHPDQFARSSFTHPSLLDRVQWIRNCLHNPNLASQFHYRFTLFQLTIVVLIVTATVTLTLV